MIIMMTICGDWRYVARDFTVIYKNMNVVCGNYVR